MKDVMKPVEFKKLLNWIKTEYEQEGSIFGISKENFYIGKGKPYEIWNEKYSTVLGTAAGPHTQCAQNIVAAYLCGARFFEIKTVQILDELDIEKPCIEAEHEGYNTEWSTELSVSDAYDEYVKAWILLHYIPHLLKNKNFGGEFIFNMSVGYDLKGIQSPKINFFIENLKNAALSPFFLKCKSELEDFCDCDIEISAEIAKSITLSTMHGCPPEEQESICSYLLKVKHLHTFVKLNPTLLGYDFVKNTLDNLGFECSLKEETFSNDLQYHDAVDMIGKLLDEAESNNLVFGVKLSNTLPVVNKKRILPGDEMYMSGKALYPLTVNLANKLAAEFGDRLEISYCGGAEADNITELYKTGIKPVTLATNLLKPGGYGRIRQMLEKLVTIERRERRNQKALQELSEAVLKKQSLYTKESHNLKISKELPLWDCDIAGCRNGCPLGQDIPSYIEAVRSNNYEEALRIILDRNPLPHITGHICEQPCMQKCTRNDYEEAVEIREIKKTAVLKGFDNVYSELKQAKPIYGKIAVVGAGPAGLSAAYFLIRHGYEVDVFEKDMKAGGLVRYVIPGFRLADEMIDKDISILEKMGVNFHFDREMSVSELQQMNYSQIILAIGAGISRELKLRGDSSRTISAIEFLRKYKSGDYAENKYKNIIVTGGGNSAIDGARAALRLPGVSSVLLVYRRTVKEMPADREELENALNDGIVIKELLQPAGYNNGKLICQPMKLGERGIDGRCAVSPIDDGYIELEADLVISAIGEEVDHNYLSDNEIRIIENMKTNLDGVYLIGDAFRGPSSVVQAMADGLNTAKKILKENGIVWKEESFSKRNLDLEKLKKKKAEIAHRAKEINGEEESERCLQCDLYCKKCVEVCPNRANIAIKIDSKLFTKSYQIIHIDKLCNECGNCETFCPYFGAPYKDKFTLFHDYSTFKESSSNGVYFENKDSGYFRLRGFVSSLSNNVDEEAFEIIKVLKDKYSYLLEL